MEITLFSNPSGKSISVWYNDKDAGAVDIAIIDLYGNIVLIIRGYLSGEVIEPDLKPGLYLCRVKWKYGKVSVVKMVVLGNS
ncbi:MAG: T9SS type A sorting domain-containing protein [Saprospiraceae bacterium]